MRLLGENEMPQNKYIPQIEQEEYDLELDLTDGNISNRKKKAIKKTENEIKKVSSSIEIFHTTYEFL